jgi:hypothetical protein
LQCGYNLLVVRSSDQKALSRKPRNECMAEYD